MAVSTYRQAGVDVQAADRWLSRMGPSIRSTHRQGVLKDRGSFAGLFRLPRGRFRDPVLVASTDGVGTKLKVAQAIGAHEAIGIDVVAMNTNDVITYGAQPLFFLDYLAVGTLQTAVMSRLLRGMVRGCRLSGCALLGGETATMPGIYRLGDYDVAGFCVGVAERSRLIDGSRVRAGDVIVGLASAGIHANGFSLIRKVLSGTMVKRLGRDLMVPTRIYVSLILRLLRRVPIHALVHVTGGGVTRRLPGLVAAKPSLRIRLDGLRWRVPPIFQTIQRAGGITTEEMMATFNMGIGMALACHPRDAGAVVRLARDVRISAWPIGTIERH